MLLTWTPPGGAIPLTTAVLPQPTPLTQAAFKGMMEGRLATLIAQATPEEKAALQEVADLANLDLRELAPIAAADVLMAMSDQIRAVMLPPVDQWPIPATAMQADPELADETKHLTMLDLLSAL